ncbi:MAG: ATP-binding cassette domain-containing protein [Pseudomonadota bacterium]
MADSSDRLLEVNGISRVFADKGPDPVLREVSFSLAPGDSLAVIGPSGCGKTTLLLMIAGLLEPTAGQIVLSGRKTQAGRKDVGLVLQEYGLFPWKTVTRNILLGAQIRKLKVEPENLAALEHELGIHGLGHLYPQQLSGGQRQRVALARVLLLKPELLLLDEPFAALDALTRERLQQALLDLFRRRAFSFIIVTHNIEEAAILGQRVMVLGDEPARVKAIIENPAFALDNPRISDDFFNLCVRLRRLLEGAP